MEVEGLNISGRGENLEILGYLPVLLCADDGANENGGCFRIAWFVHCFLIRWHDVDVISIDGKDSFMATKNRLTTPDDVFLMLLKPETCNGRYLVGSICDEIRLIAQI